MNSQFTLNTYSDICIAIKESGYKLYTFKEYLDFDEPPKNKYLILRHDVDRFAYNSLNMAELENDLDIISTYYFRTSSQSFNRSVIAKINKMGHEVGYHYEDFAVSSGNFEKAIKRFKNNLKRFKDIGISIKTISMHGSPGRKNSSYDLWSKYDYKSSGILGDANLDINYESMYYFTDTGRSWKSKNNLRDYASNSLKHKVNTNEELISFIRNNESPIILQTHPERWSVNLLQLTRSYLLDMMTNLIKKVYRKLYH